MTFVVLVHVCRRGQEMEGPPPTLRVGRVVDWTYSRCSAPQHHTIDKSERRAAGDLTELRKEATPAEVAYLDLWLTGWADPKKLKGECRHPSHLLIKGRC